MKITSTPVITESPDLHRGDGGADTTDPTMAFLAALGPLLPGAPIVPATVPTTVPTTVSAKTDATMANGLTLDVGVAGAANTGSGVQSSIGLLVKTVLPTTADVPFVDVLKSDVPSDVSNGSTKSLNVALSELATVPKQPLIAADRVGVLVATTTGTTKTDSVKDSPSLNIALPNNAADGVSADLVAVPKQPLVASDRVGIPLATISTVTTPTLTTPDGNVDAESVQVLTTPTTTTPTTTVHKALPNLAVGTQNPSIAIAPSANSSNAQVANETPVVSASSNEVVETPTNEQISNVVTASVPVPKASGTSTRESKIGTQPAATFDETDKTPTTKISTSVRDVSTSTQNQSETVATDSGVKSFAEPASGREPGKSKLEVTETARSGEQKIESDPISVNPSQPPTTARTEAASSVVSTASQRPQVAAQIAPFVTALRHEPNGTHQITVLLHPADLGQVQIVVELRDGTVNLQMSGSHDAARDVLNSAMPQLRRELTDSGLLVGRTDVLSQDSGTAGGSFTGGAFSGGPRQGFQPGLVASNLENNGLITRNSPEPLAPDVRRATHAGAVDVSI